VIRSRHQQRFGAVTGLVLALLLVAVLSACGSAGGQQVPSYRVLDAKNETRIVLVEPGIEPEGLRTICADLYGKQDDSGGLVVWFYDFAQLTEYSGPTLGLAWYSAQPIRGDTPSPSLATSSLRDVDWSRRPTETQVAVWVYRQQLAWESKAYAAGRGSAAWSTDDLDYQPPTDPETRKAIAALDRLAARHFGLPLDEVQAAVKAVDAWTTMPVGWQPAV